MECLKPFSDTISNCETAVIVNAHLEPNKSYQWLITDKFDHEFVGVALTDADGNFEIPVDELPDGLLNSYGGWFSLQVLDLYTSAVVDLKMCGFFDAIEFQVKGGTREKDNLGVE